MKISTESVGNQRLRLRWYHQGRQYCVALGVQDGKLARAFAATIAAQIESDILSGHFDATLLKYKPHGGKQGTIISAVELWRRYTDWAAKERNLSKGTLGRYKALNGHLERVLGSCKCDAVSEARAHDVVAHLNESCCASTVKQFVWLLRSAWDWAAGKYHVVNPNPWQRCSDRLKPSPRKIVKPFTQTELDRALATIRDTPSLSHYYPVVLFLATTGCRPGEAMALRWLHLNSNAVLIADAVNRQGEIKQTKTEKTRTVYLPPQFAEWLNAQRREPDDLMFPAPRGGLLCDKRLNKVWKRALEAAGVEYRRSYTIRHTVISKALEKGYTPTQIAEQTGHHPRVLMDVYAHTINSVILGSDLFGT